MARPAVALGTERPTPQGYIRVRVSYNDSETGWALKHHVVAWAKYGRHHDPSVERVVFKDNDRTNYDPDNIEIVGKAPRSLRTRQEQIAELKDRIDDYEYKLRKLRAQLEKLEGDS